ncbi:Hsp20/alpha crystallin family protein [Brugia malayi]|uniref:Bm10885, isoform b n=1 Tax=Brugia malayi TaxID=6279 RepID=A0A0K0IPV5_BRUMA|nr:Hsp20/alpha crystallin family protein [Brugia malayi]CRZ25739.1 Bm10885, isoform b [Brugia malayi]VIO90934.1 Hsp20/alpha crystallin family protein [Brugia malayi]
MEKVVRDSSEKNSISNCICDRPERTVKCLTCGATFRGHAALVCNEHPRRINLMDVRLCPNTSCRSAYLMEFEEG